MRLSPRKYLLVIALLVFTSIFIWIHLKDDTVVLSSTSGQENGVLVSGQGSTGAVSDETHTSPGDSVDVGRLTTAPNRNEVIAFTNSRPVAISQMVKWTSGSDTVNLSFAGEIEISVTIWILKTPFASQMQAASNRCIAVATLWRAERMGVKFATDGCDIRDATSFGTQFPTFACTSQGRVQAAIPPIANRINIYVFDRVRIVSGSGPGNGTSCGASDFEALGSIADAGVAIHELGHNFSLPHIDANGVILPGFDVNNIMHSASGTRQYFTEGQLFRAHFTPANLMAMPPQPGSALNSVYTTARMGQPVRDCTIDPCPALEKRIWADGMLLPN